MELNSEKVGDALAGLAPAYAAHADYVRRLADNFQFRELCQLLEQTTLGGVIHDE